MLYGLFVDFLQARKPEGHCRTNLQKKKHPTEFPSDAFAFFDTLMIARLKSHLLYKKVKTHTKKSKHIQTITCLQ